MVPLLLFLWIGTVLRELAFRFVLPAVEFPLAQLLRTALSQARPIDAPTSPPDPLATHTTTAPDCDVWLVPFGKSRVKLAAPQVLVIWDLVHQHVSNTYSPEAAEQTDRVLMDRVRSASIVCCASRFVRDNDLRRFFLFAGDRLRTFSMAPLLDLTGTSASANDRHLRRKYGIGKRYLFYPAVPRPHKNHGTLLRALAILHREYDEPDLELVCTGKGTIPPELNRLIDEEGLQRHVHFLQTVPRAEILALYRHALMAVVPSLYEGYGLPVLEALQNGCLLACSDIPAFRELLDGHLDSVPFFDPRYPHSLAAAVKQTLTGVEELRNAQALAYRSLARRDWKSVAEEFHGMFLDARKQNAA
jgi:glycosyltransferase involved in cell wall biosynthesis